MTLSGNCLRCTTHFCSTFGTFNYNVIGAINCTFSFNSIFFNRSSCCTSLAIYFTTAVIAKVVVVFLVVEVLVLAEITLATAIVTLVIGVLILTSAYRGSTTMITEMIKVFISVIVSNCDHRIFLGQIKQYCNLARLCRES